MNNSPCLLFRPLAAALLLMFSGVHSISAGNLAPNGSFEEAGEEGTWPAGWSGVKSGGSWGMEEGNRFLRLESPAAGEMVMLYQELRIPEGVGALEFSWRQRVSGLKVGAQPWFDARIMLEFLDSGREKVGAAPRAPNAARDSGGWVEKRVEFLVPEGVVWLKFMPALFQAAAGTFDLDDIVIRPVDAAPIRAAAEKAEAERREKLLAEAAARRKKAAEAFGRNGQLIANGGFEADSKNTGWPDHWGRPQGAEWAEEDGGRFMRLKALEPGKTVMLHRQIDLPEGAEALELSWRQRVTGLKKGAQPWFDARIMLEFKDAFGGDAGGKPSPPYTQRDSDGWVEKKVEFLVPAEAVSLVMMPALFEVNAGTLDLDEMSLRPVDAGALHAAKRKAEELAAASRVPREDPDETKWPAELKVAGNRLVDPAGNEIWLQGVNIPSLEWSAGGENVLRSTLVAIEDWKSTVLRLPVKEEYWFDEKGGESYRDLVDQVVTLAANRGVYVVLDLHRYRAPRQEHMEFWADAASRYKNHPALIFDLINEPHGISWETWRNGGFVEEKNQQADEDAFLTAEERAQNKQGFQSPGMQAMLDKVRATGARNLVVAGGLDWAYDLSGVTAGYALEDPQGNGVMYASHVYPWKRGWQEKLLDAAALHPILVGEVGADANKMTWMPLEAQEDAESWVPDMLGLIQKYRLNWTGWSFHPKASPRMLLDWDYTPTPFWGAPAKAALSGEAFELKKLR
jgi:endoglucanase